MRTTAKEIGGVTLLAAVDEPDHFARRIIHLRSYLGAYTGTFRTGGTVLVAGKPVHLRNGDHSGFGVELTPWNTGTPYLANRTGYVPMRSGCSPIFGVPAANSAVRR
ncbi:hypothetical protein ACFY2M_33525 [Streptomyces sp. NPDC001276]|uniref:hypothetical protein n=1 Tax=Streptomyces sp. NPDC001276 TaxID=3364555 RepID=UPI00368EECCD